MTQSPQLMDLDGWDEFVQDAHEEHAHAAPSIGARHGAHGRPSIDKIRSIVYRGVCPQ
jgi:hypothetical protein